MNSDKIKNIGLIQISAGISETLCILLITLKHYFKLIKQVNFLLILLKQ